ARRYASAVDLADDLERWLAGEPVRARGGGWWERARTWARRHQPGGYSAGLTLLLGAAGLGGGLGWLAAERAGRRERAREQAEAGLVQAVELRRGYRFKDAQAMLDQVRGWAGQAVDGELQGRLAEAEADLKLARALD